MDIGIINAVTITSPACRASLTNLTNPAHRGRPINYTRLLTPNQCERFRV